MRIPAPTTGLALCVLASAAAAQSTLYQHDAFAPGLGYGFNVCNIGDIDLDGANDYIVSVLKDGGYIDLFSGRSGQLIEQLQETGCYGMGLANMGDLDGDGVPDFAVSSPREDSLLAPNAGRVRVYSGVDRSVLYILEGDQSAARYGISLSNAGDATGDGIDDLIVGSWWDDIAAFDSGSVDLHSGVDGAHVWQASGSQAEEWFGTAVSAAGDVNADGTVDVLVGAPYRWYNNLPFPAGSVQVLSGVDGSVLRVYPGANNSDHFGTSVELVPDIDGDGVPEHVIGSPRHKVFGQQLGAVFVYSGATGLQLTLMTGAVGSRFGTRVASSDDMDGDGQPELVVSACACVNVGPSTGTPGAVEIRSPLDGALLGRIEGAPLVGFAYSVDTLGDLNGDGVGEFVFGNHWDDTLGMQTGSAAVASYSDLALSAGEHLVSVASGGATPLSISAGPAHAGEIYWVIGSISGTEPGRDVNGVHVPLNLDAFTSNTIANPNSHWMQNSMGNLDGNGDAAATVLIPGGEFGPAFVGLTGHFVVGVLTGSGLVFASNPVPISLID